MFAVYVVLVHLAFLLLWPVLLLHPRLREGLAARLGFHARGWPGLGPGPRIWLHGASAGDLLALQPVIAALRRRLPECRLLLTTVTNSGMALARQGRLGVDAVGYLPYDLPWAVGRVVRRVRPAVLVLEYAEVWPALIRYADRAGARILISNGRFHERALGRYRLLYRLIGNPLARVDRLCMRDPLEAQHALAIGAPAERVRVTGNTKFDRVAAIGTADPEAEAELRCALGVRPGDRLWVAGSTHEGEEGLLLEVFAGLRRDRPDLRLVIAPRYPERAGRVCDLAAGRGLDCGLRSAGAGREPVVVLDTVGELARLYRLAAVVFAGGSFVERGGQNILEPAACARPVLFGPHMENFADSVRVLQGRGGIQLPDAARLQRTLAELLASPDELERLGRMAQEAVRSVSGASQANAEAIAELLGAAESEPGP